MALIETPNDLIFTSGSQQVTLTCGYTQDGPSREFLYDATKGKWTNHEIDNATDGKKQFRIRMPSGRMVPIPNFYETFAQYKQERREREGNMRQYSDVEFRDGLIPMVKEFGQSYDKYIYCNLLTGKWSEFYMETSCKVLLLEPEVAHLAQRVQQLETRLKKTEQMFESILDHVRDRPSVASEFEQIAQNVSKQ